jgi:hypothetical protein
LNTETPIPNFTFSPYRLGCLGVVILMPVAADQSGWLAYLGALLLVLPLLFLEHKQNLRKTFAILGLGALLSLSTVLIFGLSDFPRYAMALGFFVLAFFLPKPRPD